MSAKYQAYPEYKDSGIEWLGVIPVHWFTTELKRYSAVQGGYAFNSDSFIDAGKPVIRIGDIKQDGSVSLDSCKYIKCENADKHSQYEVQKDDLLMAMTGATIGKAGWYKEKQPALLNQRVGSFKCNRSHLNYQFFWYVLNSSGYQEYIKLTAFGGAQPNISDAGMVGYQSAFPLEHEQQQIANFLDNETAKIDILIEKQQQLIKLLKEKRQAVISHAVTKGLNPNVPMRDSGVEWLGEVPEHWTVGRLKNALRIRNGKDYKHVEVESDGYPVYGSGGIFKQSSNYLYEGKSVLFGRKGTVDKPLLVEGRFWTVDTMFYSEIFKVCEPEYIHSQASLFPFDLLSTNTALPSMTQEDLLGLGFSIPPLNEQKEIIHFIAKNNCKFDEIVSKAEIQVALLQERRTALISAAVTGKIDVRVETPNLI